ncbi:MAG: DUF998 domain-containing protein [Candidatus Bathyarchaeia archaeon]
MNRLQLAGTLILVAGIQFVLGAHIAESTYPGYSVNQNYLSDLGATVRFTESGVSTIIQQPASLIFTIIVFAVGALATTSAYLIFRATKAKRLVIFMGLFGIAMLGIAVFSEVFTLVHGVFSLIAFFSFALAAIFSFRFHKRPMNYVSVILGVIALTAIFLLELSSLDQILPELGLPAPSFPSFNTPIGIGGMERMIAYPMMLWLVMFGASLIAAPEFVASRNNR